jgi:carboxymethylenebutenolidase
MERKKASEYPQELWHLLENLNHGFITRREFFERASKYAVGGITVAALLDTLQPNYALGQQIPATDPRIKAEYATAPSPQGNGEIKGYLARPAGGTGKFPGIVVVHGASGLNPHIEDVARRLGIEGFMAFAADGNTTVGGNPGGTVESGEGQLRKVDAAKLIEDFIAAARWLKARNDCTGQVGVLGFCYGGNVANTLAVRMPDLTVSVPYYGQAPAAADVSKIKAAVLAHYAELDTRLTSQWPGYEAALKENKVRHEGYIYPKVNHAFYNDSGARYDEVAAKLSWQRTIAFLNRYMKSS